MSGSGKPETKRKSIFAMPSLHTHEGETKKDEQKVDAVAGLQHSFQKCVSEMQASLPNVCLQLKV